MPHSQIQAYFSTLPDQKRADLETLHQRIQQLYPKAKLWFLDGQDENGKIVSNPNIGYGQLKLNYANGKTKDFYQIGISANTTGISVFIMGLRDKSYLPETYGTTLGKAKITAYCIKFKALKDINIGILEQAIQDGISQTSTPTESSGIST